MRFLKSLLSWLFGLAIRIRSHLYKRGLLRSKKLRHPVVCIGNLTLGGTGKTPLVAYLAIRLRESGFAPVILSRGYKGKLGSTVMLVSDGKQISGTPELCGDEPYLLAQKLEGVVVAVGKDRFKAGQAVADQPEGTIFLLDDGFQHWKLQRQLDLLVIDGSCSLKKEALLPAGRLREPLSAMARADAIVVTREHLSPDLKALLKEIRVWNPTAPVFPFSHEFDAILDL
ncbi:MAG: tetraacyldisaccharide 4'-kinase, partial [bacterium]